MMNKNWEDITAEESYRLSMAEFKGATMQALKDLNNRVANLENYNMSTRLLSFLISSISGIVSGLFGSQIKQ